MVNRELDYKQELIKLLDTDEQVKKERTKLDFGCEVLFGDKRYPRSKIITKYMSYIECGCRDGGIAGAAFTNWKCQTRGCDNKGTSGNTSTPKICEECARNKNKCQFCGKYFEIIGLPLQERFIRMFCENNGIYIVFNYNGNVEYSDMRLITKLDNTKDFDNQSQEVRKKIFLSLTKFIHDERR